jgi:sulfur relay (sulfurtransferase) DsrF/TusC family protein
MPAEGTGQKTVAITTNATDKLVIAGTGRLNAILCTGAINAANALFFYDSATAQHATGTVIGYIAASTIIGTFQAYDIPFALGISVYDAGANSNTITVVYSVS